VAGVIPYRLNDEYFDVQRNSMIYDEFVCILEKQTPRNGCRLALTGDPGSIC
jgi:hypothetical protein